MTVRIEEHSIQTEGGRIKWRRIRPLSKKTKYFKAYHEKATAMTILLWKTSSEY